MKKLASELEVTHYSLACNPVPVRHPELSRFRESGVARVHRVRGGGTADGEDV